MSYNPHVHQRHSLRLKSYDYRQDGAYFVTVCVHARQSLMGRVIDGRIQINEVGEAVIDAWEALPARFPCVQLDAFVVMPNHIHGIVWIAHTSDIAAVHGAASGAPTLGEGMAAVHGAASSAPTLGEGVAAVHGAASSAPTLGEIMRAFKSLSAIAANRALGRNGVPFWQRNYYEHVVRNDHDLDEIRRYIAANPANWEHDDNNLQPRP